MGSLKKCEPRSLLRAAIGSENGSDEATAHPRSSHATLISTRHRWALKAASVDATVATQSLREPKLLLLDLDYIRFRDPNLLWKALNRAKPKKVSSEPLLWLDRGLAPAKDGTKTIEETPREVGEPARRTTPWPPPRGPGATQAGAGGCVRAPDVHMGPSGAWGVSGVLKLVYK